MPHPAPRGPSPRDATDIILRRNQGSQITASTNQGNYAASSPKGARALGMRQTLSQAGTRAPRLLLSRIQATMPHPAPKGREPSGDSRHDPRLAPRLPIVAITNPCDHVYLAHECPPWPRGQEGPSGLGETAPSSPRARNGQRARNPNICSVLAILN